MTNKLYIEKHNGEFEVIQKINEKVVFTGSFIEAQNEARKREKQDLILDEKDAYKVFWNSLSHEQKNLARDIYNKSDFYYNNWDNVATFIFEKNNLISK